MLSIRYTGRCPVLEEMLITPGTCTPHPLQQAVARLLNTIASLRCGRDYLAPSHSLLKLLVTTLRQDNNVRIDQMTADMLLATLQKLSLRFVSKVLFLCITVYCDNLVFWLGNNIML